MKVIKFGDKDFCKKMEGIDTGDAYQGSFRTPSNCEFQDISVKYRKDFEKLGFSHFNMNNFNPEQITKALELIPDLKVRIDLIGNCSRNYSCALLKNLCFVVYEK